MVNLVVRKINKFMWETERIKAFGVSPYLIKKVYGKFLENSK